MATIFDTVSIVGKRATHFEQLLNYLCDAEESGVYYGNKYQFYKRHNEIKDWLEGIVKDASDPNLRIPKK
jgi:hypothetical protein